MSYLSWENLVVGYERGTPLIYPFTGQIHEPGIYTILGQNGCGKSTLMKTWLGLLTPLSGQFQVHHTSRATSARGISYIPQVHAVNRYFHITVGDFIKQGCGPEMKKENIKETEIQALFEEWQLAGYETRSFHELSEGQKTRAMIIRAILAQPKILFLDEPLASLDSCCQLQLVTALAKMVKEQELCVLLIDHHFENFKSYIHREIIFTRRHDDDVAKVEIRSTL